MRAIRIGNTLGGKTHLFTPLHPPRVTMYTCGVTVYNYPHIGNARVHVVMDTVHRILEASGYHVTAIQNFTDIDDKIIQKMGETGQSLTELTAYFMAAYQQDITQLHVNSPTRYTHATAFVPQMIDLIGQLINRGVAYVSDAQDVWFSVAQFPDYGRLSGKVLSELDEGVRQALTPGKQSPHDFVLWKSAKPGEPSWPSPWGPGRPGWHIECSAMAMHELGPSIDIHAGGEDLIFPHHENEIAQSECCTGHPFAAVWMHIGFVTMRQEKMSKSLGNVALLRDVLTQYSGNVIRLFLLKTHYRSPLDFSDEGLQATQVACDKLITTIQSHADAPMSTGVIQVQEANLLASFWEALTTDFNVAKGIGFLFDLVRLVNTHGVSSHVLSDMASLIGLRIPTDDTMPLPEPVQQLLSDRWHAKQSRQFELADQLRHVLLTDHGIVVEDHVDGYRWKHITPYQRHGNEQ